MIAHLKTSLEVQTDQGRAKLVKDGSALIRAFIGLDDQMWRDLVEIVLENHGMDWSSVYESDELEDEGWDGELEDEGWDGEGGVSEAPAVQPGPVVEFTGIDRLITQVVNSCNTSGKASIARVKDKLDELSAEILHFAVTYCEQAEDIVGTYGRLLEMGADIGNHSTSYAKELYSKFEISRQLKTALNLRKSRIRSVIHWVEYPIDPLLKEHKLKKVGVSTEVFREWIQGCKYIWIVGIGYANRSFYNKDTGYSVSASFALKSTSAVQELTKPQHYKLVNATLKEWDIFVQEIFNDIYDPGITSKIASRMSRYEESISALLAEISNAGNGRWDARREVPMAKEHGSKAKHEDFTFPTGITLDVKTQLSRTMGLATSARSLSFIFNLPIEWAINLDEINLRLSIAAQKFPLLGDVEVVFTSKIGDGGSPQILATIPLTNDETWLTSFRVFLLEVIDKLLTETNGK